MKDQTLYFDFQMTAMCPECGIENDFEEHEEGEDSEDRFYLGKFKDWIMNINDKICTVVTCQHCDKDFRLTEIGR